MDMLLPRDPQSEPMVSPIIDPPRMAPPSTAQQSWGTIVSIIIIMAMIITGAFYAWGKRIADEQAAYSQQSILNSTGQ